MPIGDNKPDADRLIKKTTGKDGKASDTSKASKTGKTREPTPYSKKATFYLKPDLYDKLEGFAFWDRHTITEAVNIVLEDGLKGKTTKPKPKDRK
jgi:hypothetical protein